MSPRKLVITPDPTAEVGIYHRWPQDDTIASASPVVVRQSLAAYQAAHAHVMRGLLASEGGEQPAHRLEVKGALLGLPIKHAETGQIEVHVHQAIPLPILEVDSPTSCVYRAHDKVKIDLLCEREFGGLQVVGWFHSHPGLRVFLSNVDRETMELSFPLPHHVALVIDPVQDEAAYFVWDDGRIDQRARECFVPSALPGISAPRHEGDEA